MQKTIYLNKGSYHHCEPFASLFYMIFRMYDMFTTSDAHLNTVCQKMFHFKGFQEANVRLLSENYYFQ